MPLRLGALHDALLDPGNAEKAQKAAEELAGYDNQLASIRSDLRILTWMVGAIGLLGLGTLWLSYSILARLIDLAGTIGALAARLPQ
jgi:hypothetical protein